MDALAAALDEGNEANRASLRAVARGIGASIDFEDGLGHLIDKARATYRLASMEFTARGINELEQCPGTMGLNTALPFELDEYEALRRSSRSESSQRADDLRRLYAEIAAHWRRTCSSAK